jgi:hypothetical protein
MPFRVMNLTEAPSLKVIIEFATIESADTVVSSLNRRGRFVGTTVDKYVRGTELESRSIHEIYLPSGFREYLQLNAEIVLRLAALISFLILSTSCMNILLYDVDPENVLK